MTPSFSKYTASIHATSGVATKAVNILNAIAYRFFIDLNEPKFLKDWYDVKSDAHIGISGSSFKDPLLKEMSFAGRPGLERSIGAFHDDLLQFEQHQRR